MHLGKPRAVVCVEGARGGRRSGAFLDPLRPRPLDEGGRGRLRRGHAHQRRDAAPRDVAAVRAGKRRRRSVDDAVGSPLIVDDGVRIVDDAIGKLTERTQMAYSNKVIDHYENPRNVGSMPKEDPNVGTGLVGAPECGDVMKLQVKVNPDTGVIDDAKFKTFGCGSAIASSSLATEWLKGKTVDEALAIKNTDIVNELSLPPVKIHCSVLAEDAIKAAISDYKKKQGVKTASAGDHAQPTA